MNAWLARTLARLAGAFEIRIVKGVVSKDHVHILVSCPPTMAPSEIMRRIKGRTSSKLFEEYPHIKERYWVQAVFMDNWLKVTGQVVRRGLLSRAASGRQQPGTGIFELAIGGQGKHATDVPAVHHRRRQKHRPVQRLLCARCPGQQDVDRSPRA